MPDSGILPVADIPVLRGGRRRVVSPLLRRILLVNALPLALLVAAVLYLDQYQAGLLEANVQALREQARIYAGALGESAVREQDPDNPVLQPDQARPLLAEHLRLVTRMGNEPGEATAGCAFGLLG